MAAQAAETASIIRPPHSNIHESVHSTCKRLKCMRALLRLVMQALGNERFENENRVLRDIGRSISGLRDAHVLAQALTYVAMEAHSVKPVDVEQGVAALEDRSRQALDRLQQDDNRPLETIASDLDALSSRVTEWPEIPESWESLAPGLRAVYGKGRQWNIEAKNNPGKKSFHEWRKQVKYLLHQYQLLVHYWPEALGINGKSLQQLSDYLGEEHDLAMLSEELGHAEFEKTVAKIPSLRSFIEQKRAFLQRSALNLGDYIYAQSEDEYVACFIESENVA